jgi:HSP20 family molecular chaperone IbpA
MSLGSKDDHFISDKSLTDMSVMSFNQPVPPNSFKDFFSLFKKNPRFGDVRVESHLSHYLICAFLPGVDPDKMIVSLKEDVLFISCVSFMNVDPSAEIFLKGPQFTKVFKESVILPGCDPASLSSAYKDSYLKIRVSKF